MMVAMAEPVAHMALSFSSPEFFAIVFFGLISVVALSGDSVVNSLISLCMGLLIATVGVDSIYGAERFAFGQPFLLDGIEFLLVMVGAYGIGEVLTRLRAGFAAEPGEAGDGQARVRTALPRWAEIVRMKYTLRARSPVVVGIVPGAGATVSALSPTGWRASTAEPAARHRRARGHRRRQVGGHRVGRRRPCRCWRWASRQRRHRAIILAFLLHGIQPGLRCS